MNKLTVFKNAQGWHVRFDEGEEREGVVAVMGTDTIPLPFTVRAKAETVVLDIQQRYPGADITVDVSGLHHGLLFEQKVAPGLPKKASKPSWTEVPGEVA